MEIDAGSLRPAEAYKLLISSLVPRPIAFVSTVSASGARNLAPFSFFMGVGSNPPMVALGIGRHADGPKDTLRNIRDTGELVINLVSEEIAEAMNVTSGEYDYGVDEFELARLTPVPCARVKAPRAAESPVSYECRVAGIHEYGLVPNTLVVCEVLAFHVRDDLYLADKKRVDTERLHAVGRLGGPQYCRVRDIFEMERPAIKRAPKPAK
jgi:flavin reductase (DIM6/NTAB) family NADH-FMN oxidoreductase RutF